MKKKNRETAYNMAEEPTSWLQGPPIATGRRPRAGGTPWTGCRTEYDGEKVAGVVVDARTMIGGSENTSCDGWKWSWSAAAVMGEEEDE